jgi:hypothetical protein
MIEDLGNWVLFYFACMMLHRIYSATLDDNQKNHECISAAGMVVGV